MKIAINAISATAGGARTYLLNLARVLPGLGSHEYQLYLPSSAVAEMADLPRNFRLVVSPWAEHGYAARLLWEQLVLAREVKRWGADVLLCVGNFCPLRCPVPVVLLSRNPLYFTPRFLADLIERRHYIWAAQHVLMTRLALWSARTSRLTITPTAAMGAMIRTTAGKRPPFLRTIHHGFQLWPGLNGRLRTAPPHPPFRFLLVSPYNYFRNFETVFRAIAELRSACGAGRLHLYLTTRLGPGLKLGGYDTTRAHMLIEELGIREMVTTLGPVKYDSLPDLYASAHAVICPAYTESFSHTVVEAMAMGVPVIASDISIHREVAGEAALFFSPLEPADMARRCRDLMDDESLQVRLRTAGAERARIFSWRRHFEELLEAIAGAAG